VSEIVKEERRGAKGLTHGARRAIAARSEMHTGSTTFGEGLSEKLGKGCRRNQGRQGEGAQV